MKILWIFLGGHRKIGLYSGVISMYFRVFPSGQGTEWEWVGKISNVFLGCLRFLIFFGGRGGGKR